MKLCAVQDYLLPNLEKKRMTGWEVIQIIPELTNSCFNGIYHFKLAKMSFIDFKSKTWGCLRFGFTEPKQTHSFSH